MAWGRGLAASRRVVVIVLWGATLLWAAFALRRGPPAEPTGALVVVLRRTQKLARQLAVTADETDDGSAPDTALGDWYVNRFVVDQRPLLILVSARSLLPLLLSARDVRSLPLRLPDLVATRLRRMGVPARHIMLEVNAMSPVRVGKTVNRSVVGILVDFAFNAPYLLERGGWDENTLPFVEAKLARTPCFVGRPGDQTIFPDRVTRALLAARWDEGQPSIS